MDQFFFFLISGKKGERKQFQNQDKKTIWVHLLYGERNMELPEKGLGDYLWALIVSSFSAISPIPSGQYQTSVQFSFQQPVPAPLICISPPKPRKNWGQMERKPLSACRAAKAPLRAFVSNPTVCWVVQEWTQSTDSPWTGPALSPLSGSCLVQQMSPPRRKKSLWKKMHVML